MATFNSDLTVKGIRHRGVYEGKTQPISGYFRLNPGQTLTTADLLRMVPLGENVRPTALILQYKEVSGTPVVTGGSFSVGVEPLQATNVKRPDGTEFPPLSADADLYSAAADLGAASQVNLTVTAPPSTNTKWGPFYLTLTPTESTSVAGGSIDVFLTVEFQGEHEEAEQVYSTWAARESALA